MQLLRVRSLMFEARSIKHLLFAFILMINLNGFSQEIVKDNGITKEILKDGKGENAKIGQTVKINLTGTLTDGFEFESGIMSFVIGDKDMIAGFNEVLPTMKKGEKVKVTLPPAMGYGEKEMKDGDEVLIPAKSTLIFEIQLLNIK